MRNVACDPNDAKRIHYKHDKPSGLAAAAKAAGTAIAFAAFFSALLLHPEASASSIYAIRPDGQMLFYRYAGMADGSNRWSVEQKVIGTGWQGFARVFAGDNGAIYAIQPDGQMLFYRYAGMADGSNRWAVEQKVIGTGWGFRLVTGGGTGSAAGAPTPASAPPAPPAASAPPAPRPAANNPKCREYATRAVADFRQASGLPKCARAMQQDNPGRWHDRFDQHYEWCLTAQPAWLNSENGQRDKLLMSCGGRSTY